VFIPVYATLFYLFQIILFIKPRKIFCTTSGTNHHGFGSAIVFPSLRATGKISSMMAPLLSERKIPLVIQSFCSSFCSKSITIERYPELHFFL
jgi:hypothetical protein